MLQSLAESVFPGGELGVGVSMFEADIVADILGGRMEDESALDLFPENDGGAGSRPSTLALDREDNLVVTVVLAAKVRHPSLAFDNYTLKQGTDFENIRPSNYMKH